MLITVPGGRGRLLFLSLALLAASVLVQALPAFAQGKVIYGTDDRIDVYQETDPDRLGWAASTCALVNASQLTNNGNGTWTLRTSDYTYSGRPACDGEPFGDQPVAPFCTGFAVGSDLIATAGHCFETGDESGTRFVFGFKMLNATTVVTTFTADQIYTGVEVLAHELQGDYDYTVLRVDRPITAPGAAPMPLRRSGVVPVGTPVGVIGHPTGLPMKIAFGPTTAVRSNDRDGYFLANLDTYGGNSGSPVFNATTGLVEGILVRGDTDFLLQGSCFVSNTLGDSAGSGESVSKALTFISAVPSLGGGTVAFDSAAYGCSDTATVTVTDQDLVGTGTVGVTLTSSAGDSETLFLAETASAGTFTGSLAVQTGAATPDNGVLEASPGGTITAAYQDAANASGVPATVTDTAGIDCTAPVVTGVSFPAIGGSSATVSVTTNEPTTLEVYAGAACGQGSLVATDGLATSHAVLAAGLQPGATYYVSVELRDAAGNLTVDDNGGACYLLTTSDEADPLTMEVDTQVQNLNGLSITFRPAAGGYTACTANVTGYPADSRCGRFYSLDDDAFVQVSLEGGKTFPFFGIPYSSFYLGSNGYITFGAGDEEYEAPPANHFDLPRISALFTDLDPEVGGSIVVEQWEDRVSITWDGVPEWNTHTPQYFQAELFFDGAIRLAWISLGQLEGIAGLSAGTGVPANYLSSDFTAYPGCTSVYPTTECINGPICGGGSPSGTPREAFGDLTLMGLAALVLATWAVRRHARAH